MMEVKQSTTVDLNDLLTVSKNNGSDEVDDAVMTDISDETPHGLVNCDLIKHKDESETITDVENGDVAMTSLINDVDDDACVDMNTTVNSELEDALLAEDDVLPEVPKSKEIEETLSATDDILADKADTSNSTTSSNNVRDPGDDLDTLLSKINDIVEDCIENESENTVANVIKQDQAVDKKVEIQEKGDLNESALVIEQKNVTDDLNLLEEEKPEQDVKEEVLCEEKSSCESGSVIENDTTITSDLRVATTELSKNVDGVAETEDNRLDSDGRNASVAEPKVNNDEMSPQLSCVENLTENNLNLQKTEESNAEVVQDNKITSNGNEVLKDVKSAQSTTIDDGVISSPKINDSSEINKTPINNEKSETNVDEAPTNEKTIKEEIMTSGSLGNDESDDEIVFYVDQTSEVENSKETETKSSDTAIEKTETLILNKEVPPLVEKSSQGDDDVVLLLDDEDEEVVQLKKELSTKEVSVKEQGEQNESNIVSTGASTEAKAKNILIDNSDNARDDFSNENATEKEKTVDKADVSQTAEETNSNCSSSSNLLQEAKSIKTVADEPTPEENENEEEEDDGDVELIIGELKDTESLEKVEDSETAPPAKRIRLSGDDEQVLEKRESIDVPDEVESLSAVEKKQECQENMVTEKCSVKPNSTLKRSHDVIELEADEKSNDSEDEISKKPKTDSLKTVVILSEKKSEDVEYIDDSKNNIKAVPSYEPIRLYPAPEFNVLKSELPMSLDFLKKFRKSFDNMTKQDLEELVLQKIVEAIIHRSEFSEMRELIEKQEKLISAHRSKISELSKQFRDLEMVHNRVVKDIEQRNSQFIMPVKITRAVGLQVYIPNKKSLAEATSNAIAPNIPLSPQRPGAPQPSSTTSTSTSAQRQFLSSQTEIQRPASSISSLTGNTGNIRRGCIQKITPIRPVPGSTQSPSSGPTAVTSSAYSNTPNYSAAAQPRILNKNATTITNSTSTQRPRYLGSSQDNPRMPPQQQISRTPNIPANSERMANTASQSKPTSSVATAVQRRSESLPSQTTNSSTSSIVDNYINTLTHLAGGNTAVSITPAKPKEKAVIDLTDEDETPAQSPGPQAAPQMPGIQVQRRSLPAQNSSSSQVPYGRTAPPLVRVPPSTQMINNKNRQMSSLQGQKNSSFTSISTPPGTRITRISVAPVATNAQRVKYSHPAPLPATPPQAFNPKWKLPPPRPTIRISNLDNGIVISWTMEESMDRHAECLSYQIYAYQETSGPPMVDSWRHVGDVKAMLLPMAVTLTQFQEGQRYYFAVRAVDCHQRYGPFSLPKTWS